MGKAEISVKKELELGYFDHVRKHGSIHEGSRTYSTAEFKIQPSQIQKWLKDEAKRNKKSKIYSQNFSVHSGPTIESFWNNLCLIG